MFEAAANSLLGVCHTNVLHGDVAKQGKKSLDYKPGVSGSSEVVCMFTWPFRLSFGFNVTLPFGWTTLVVPMYKYWRGIDQWAKICQTLL